MTQPKDYASGYDPYRTDPGFVQLITEDEVKAPLRGHPHARKDSEESDEEQRHGSPSNARPKRPFRKRTPKLSKFPHRGASMLRTALDFLIPPLDADAENIRRWRLAMGLSWFVFVFHIATSWDALGWAGLHGFAMASDVREIRAEQLYGQLEVAVRSHCLAPTEDSKTHYYKRIAELTGKFNGASDQPYQRPSCSDLGVRQVIVGGSDG